MSQGKHSTTVVTLLLFSYLWFLQILNHTQQVSWCYTEWVWKTDGQTHRPPSSPSWPVPSSCWKEVVRGLCLIISITWTTKVTVVLFVSGLDIMSAFLSSKQRWGRELECVSSKGVKVQKKKRQEYYKQGWLNILVLFGYNCVLKILSNNPVYRIH